MAAQLHRALLHAQVGPAGHRLTGRTRRARLVSLVRGRLEAHGDETTARLVRDLRGARRRGHLTRRELEAVCRWKSPRAIGYLRSNSPAVVRRVTRLALNTKDEEGRMRALVCLRGVSIPMASSILMLLDPRRYGAIDIRVWQLLERGGYVSGNPAGVGLRIGHWLQFLALVRDLARALRVTARAVERSLFTLHRERQRGALYGRTSRARRKQASAPRMSPRPSARPR
jgi:hypothetical protein